MKKLIASLICFTMLLGFAPNAHALSNELEKEMEIYSFEELATLPIEKTYSYEDVLSDMEINEIATEERIANFKAQHEINTKSISPNSTGTIRYSRFTMDSYTFYNNLIFRYELTPIFYVGLNYISSGSPDKIVSVEDPFIRTSGGSDCVFTGKIFYRLESGNSFYYGVNGDVYKTATTQISGGGQAKVGDGQKTLNIGFTYSKDFIKNVDFDGRYYSSSLNPN